MSTQLVVAFAFGVVFIATLLTLAVAYPKPTSFQYNVFRIVLSLAAAGAAATIPGFINLDLEPTKGLIVRAGGALAVFVIVFFFNPARLAKTETRSVARDERLRQKQSGGDQSINLQAGRDVLVGGRTNDAKTPNRTSGVVHEKHEQEAAAGDNSVIIQAGRDALLQVEKGPPNIRLVRLTIDDDTSQGGLRQKINVIIKNNGDRTAFLQNGFLVSDGAETIRNCNHIGMQYSLSISNWTYDVNIDDATPTFVGRHGIAPNEVVNFDVIVGRKRGGHEVTIYRCYLRFAFDEGNDLKTGCFFLKIAGPTEWQGGFQASGPSPEQWGRCQVDNISRLERIGYDYRPSIDVNSRKYVEAVSPGIFDEPRGPSA